MNQSKEISPVTGLAGVSLVETIAVEKIIELYQKRNLAVERFFDNIHKVEILRCNTTGYRYYYPFTIFGDGVFYEELHKGISDYYSEKKWEHISALKYIKPNEHVLEVGCATGFFLNQLKDKGASCVGLEFNKTAINEARQKGFEVYDEFLHAHSLNHQKVYDMVCSFQVLEHIADINDYFESAKRCLKPGGKIIIGVPNSNPYIYKHEIYHTLNLPPHHSGLWNKQAFKEVGKYFGLKKVCIKDDPLNDYPAWYKVQVDFYKEKKTWLGNLMANVPPIFYKVGIRLLSPWIEGRTLLAIFTMP